MDLQGLTLFFLAVVCSTAVRKPVGKVNPEGQNRVGGAPVLAHLLICSIRATRSRVQAARGFMEA